MGRILVTDGEQRAALAIVRSLGRAGHRCLVVSDTGRSLAGASRFAERDVAISGAGETPERYAEAVAALVREAGIDLLIPVTEPALLALLPVRERMACAIPFPPLEAVQAICDKERVLAAAQEVGIRVPRQRVVTAAGDTAVDLPLPVVLKPARSVYTDDRGRRGKVGVRWARTPEELRRGLERYPPAAYPVLVQEAVEGPGIGVFVLLHEGQVVARFAHRRLREKPPSGGVSVVRQSEPMDEALLERSLALLRRFDWSGVAMVEYKRDRRTGEDVLMEINGRFWGSLQLAIDAGVDFPRLLAALSFGKPVTPVVDYDFVRTRWLLGDLDHVLARWRGRPGDGSRLGATAGFLRAFGPGYRNEVFRWSDPRPFLRESTLWLKDVLR